MTHALVILQLKACLLAYLLGSIPFGLLITYLGGEGDIRRVGSGNIGTTNVFRTGRKNLAFATLILDAIKGGFSVLLAKYLFSDLTVGIAAVSVVIGHCYPIWLQFKGGKGVATALGISLFLSPLGGIINCGVWLIMAGLTRISSIGGLCAVLISPLSLYIFLSPPLAKQGFWSGVVIALFIFTRHRENIIRLLKGTEPTIEHQGD